MKLSLPWRRSRAEYPLVRVDDRLLHGQVVVGWVQGASLTHLILVSDRVIADAQLSAAIRSLVPEEIRVDVVGVSDGAARWQAGEFSEAPSMIVVESPGDVLKMKKEGAPVRQLVLGGLHFRDGATEILPYVFVSRWDRLALAELQKSGVRIVCQDLPATAPVPYQEQTLS